jgi:alkanesulfonate monooxygenase SsuD/methylene tetrahydromethanopterin reductase-like flavin-dependent oxidoreductase (luciferase family)
VAAFWRRNRPDEPPALDEMLRRLHIAVGGPQTVARQLSELLRVTGATTLTLQPTWECLEHESVLRSLRLFAERVRPALEHRSRMP